MPSFHASESDVAGRLRLFLWVNGLITLACLGTELVCALLGFDSKYYKPWYYGVAFVDFRSFYPRFYHLHEAGFFNFTSIPFPFAYPAPAAFVYSFFLSFGHHLALPLFLLSSIAAFVFAALLLRRAMLARGLPERHSLGLVGLGVVLAYPLWFCLQRSNIEIAVWVFLMGGVWALCRNRGYSAAACFGIAASLKLVPIIYLALLVPRRQWKQIAFGLAVALVVSIGGLAFVGPSIGAAYHGIQLGLGAFQQEYLVKFGLPGTGWDHTVMGMYRRWHVPTPFFPLLLHWYTLTTAVLGSILWLVRIRVMPFLNQVVALFVAGVWLVPVSFEYTLIHLYAPVGCLLLAHVGSRASKVTPYIVLLAALCAPLAEFIYHQWTFGGQIQCVLLGTLFGVSLIWQLPSDFDGKWAAGKWAALRA